MGLEAATRLILSRFHGASESVLVRALRLFTWIQAGGRAPATVRQSPSAWWTDRVIVGRGKGSQYHIWLRGTTISRPGYVEVSPGEWIERKWLTALPSDAIVTRRTIAGDVEYSAAFGKCGYLTTRAVVDYGES